MVCGLEADVVKFSWQTDYSTCINHLTYMTSTLMFFICSVAYGSDTVTIHQLFKVASALDPNPVHHISLNDLVASLRRTNMGTFIDGMTRGSKICLLAERVIHVFLIECV